MANTGLIQAPTGDVTLTGHDVRQLGVAVSSTTVTTRGTVHLLNSASDTGGKIVLGRDSATAILLEADGGRALDAQRDALLLPASAADGYRAAGQAFDHLSSVPDRRDQSRIEVTSGGTVQVEGGAMALATGGQIAVSAARRTLLENGAVLDVAGAVGVKLAMESNNVKVNIQGNEQRDAPVSRDGKTLNNTDVWVDRRTLIQIAKGVNGYERERWYTPGGLLEVGGYLGTTEHGVGEWAAVGGIVTVAGGELVSRAGSQINISGGTLDVQSGYLRQSWLRGEDGRLYEISRAPGDLLYKGLYKGFEDVHARWGDKGTRYFHNPLIGPRQRRRLYRRPRRRSAGRIDENRRSRWRHHRRGVSRRLSNAGQTEHRRRRAPANGLPAIAVGPVTGRPAGHRRIPGQELRTERQGALGLRSVCHDGKYLYPGRTAIRRAGSQPGRSLASAWKRPHFPGRRQAERYRSGADHRRRVGIRIGEKPPARGEWRSDRAVCA